MSATHHAVPSTAASATLEAAARSPPCAASTFAASSPHDSATEVPCSASSTTNAEECPGPASKVAATEAFTATHKASLASPATGIGGGWFLSYAGSVTTAAASSPGSATFTAARTGSASAASSRGAGSAKAMLAWSPSLALHEFSDASAAQTIAGPGSSTAHGNDTHILLDTDMHHQSAAQTLNSMPAQPNPPASTAASTPATAPAQAGAEGHLRFARGQLHSMQHELSTEPAAVPLLSPAVTVAADASHNATRATAVTVGPADVHAQPSPRALHSQHSFAPSPAATLFSPVQFMPSAAPTISPQQPSAHLSHTPISQTPISHTLFPAYSAFASTTTASSNVVAGNMHAGLPPASAPAPNPGPGMRWALVAVAADAEDPLQFYRPPKRAMNQFMLWSRVERPRLAREHPELQNAEISRLLGEIWKGMSRASKAPYIERAKKLRESQNVIRNAFPPAYRPSVVRTKRRSTEDNDSLPRAQSESAPPADLPPLDPLMFDGMGADVHCSSPSGPHEAMAGQAAYSATTTLGESASESVTATRRVAPRQRRATSSAVEVGGLASSRSAGVAAQPPWEQVPSDDAWTVCAEAEITVDFAALERDARVAAMLATARSAPSTHTLFPSALDSVQSRCSPPRPLYHPGYSPTSLATHHAVPQAPPNGATAFDSTPALDDLDLASGQLLWPEHAALTHASPRPHGSKTAFPPGAAAMADFAESDFHALFGLPLSSPSRMA